jgi:hypothetical protein
MVSTDPHNVPLGKPSRVISLRQEKRAAGATGLDSPLQQQASPADIAILEESLCPRLKALLE